MAIAFDSANKYTACVTGTSCTYSFNNVAGNFVGNASISYDTNPGAVSMTYAGEAMTQIGSNQATTTQVTYCYTFYKESAATGTNNLTTTTTNSLGNGFYDHAVSYSGTHASAPVANATQHVDNSNDTSDSVVVTISDTTNSWAVWLGMGDSAGRTSTAGANTVKVTGASDGQTHVFDSNGIANSNPWTLSATLNSGMYKASTGFELVMAAAGGSSSIKTINGLALASVKTVNGLAIASVKTVSGLA